MNRKIHWCGVCYTFASRLYQLWHGSTSISSPGISEAELRIQNAVQLQRSGEMTGWLATSDLEFEISDLRGRLKATARQKGRRRVNSDKMRRFPVESAGTPATAGKLGRPFATAPGVNGSKGLPPEVFRRVLKKLESHGDFATMAEGERRREEYLPWDGADVKYAGRIVASGFSRLGPKVWRARRRVRPMRSRLFAWRGAGASRGS
jgi:hypothetical protein